jgi:hypothetical protein
LNLIKSKKQVEQNVSNNIESLNKDSFVSSSVVLAINDHQEQRNNLKLELEKIEKLVVDTNNQIKKISLELKKEHQVMPRPPPIKPNNPSLDPINQFQYLLGIKGKNTEVTIVPINSTSESEIRTIKIGTDCFTDSYGFSSFPLDHSRYVNLHDSILITAGMEKGISYDNCYLITITNLNNNYTAIVSNYAPLKEKRERHNIIYIEHLGAVLVCSGFYTKTCEINYLNSKDTEWKFLPPMRESRANATMFCVNRKNIYCVGGFHVPDKDKPHGGTYLNSVEFIDTTNFNSGWKYLELMSFNSNLKLCAMGVINSNQNGILLVGGYDGQKYLTEVNEFLFDQDGNIIRVIPNGPKRELGRGVIFTSNQNFISTPFKKMINFDSNCRLLLYDYENEEFTVRV